MPEYGTGIFYGYREEAVVYERPPRLRPGPGVSPMQLSPPQMEMLGITAYDYRSFNGYAPGDYGAWILLPWACRMAKWMLDGGPMEVQITYDGTEVGDTRTIRASLTTLDSFVGFRVRELVVGFAVWYQCIPIL